MRKQEYHLHRIRFLVDFVKDQLNYECDGKGFEKDCNELILIEFYLDFYNIRKA